jgi:hypothetical protein
MYNKSFVTRLRLWPLLYISVLLLLFSFNLMYSIKLYKVWMWYFLWEMPISNARISYRSREWYKWHLRIPYWGSRRNHMLRPVSVEGVMHTGTKFATSAFQHDDHVTLNAQGHGHSFIDRIQHLTSHKVLGNCDDLGSSPWLSHHLSPH